MSINKLVTIRDAIYNACEDMGIETTSQIPTLTRWAYDAEKRIGSYYGWTKHRAVLDVNNCRAELPCGAMTVQYVMFGDYGCGCADLMNCISNWAQNFNPASNEIFLAVDFPDKQNFCGYGHNWEVQNNSLIFKSDFDGQKVTIQYLGYAEDKDGFLEVNENHIPAIVSYIKWNFAKRSRYSAIKMEYGDIQLNESEWLKNRAIAIADDSYLSDTERQHIVHGLNDPWIGFGLGMTNNSANPFYP